MLQRMHTRNRWHDEGESPRWQTAVGIAVASPIVIQGRRETPESRDASWAKCGCSPVCGKRRGGFLDYAAAPLRSE